AAGFDQRRKRPVHRRLPRPDSANDQGLPDRPVHHRPTRPGNESTDGADQRRPAGGQVPQPSGEGPAGANPRAAGVGAWVTIGRAVLAVAADVLHVATGAVTATTAGAGRPDWRVEAVDYGVGAVRYRSFRGMRNKSGVDNVS